MENDCRNYFMINLHESMGPGRDQTRDPWICKISGFSLNFYHLPRDLANSHDPFLARINKGMKMKAQTKVWTSSCTGYVCMAPDLSSGARCLSVRATMTQMRLRICAVLSEPLKPIFVIITKSNVQAHIQTHPVQLEFQILIGRFVFKFVVLVHMIFLFV